MPKVELVPDYATSAATDLFPLLDLVGMPLLPWQRTFLTQALGEDRSGRWAAPEVSLIVPRQNGKSYVMAARILAGLFLLGEDLITYTAHRVDTALEIFHLVDRLARACPATARRVKRTTVAAARETIETTDGQRFKVMARSRATGRGFTGDCLIFDEALELRDQAAINSLLPTLATRPNAQVFWASSAGDSGSTVLAGVRERAKAGTPGLCAVEYATDRYADPDDREALAEANPGIPSLIGWRAIARERAAMSLEGFRQERMGIWAHELDRSVIPGLVWETTAGTAPSPEPGHLGLAYDVTPDRSYSSIVAAWQAGDRTHVRVARHQAGDDWLVPELAALAASQQVPITYDDAGPARDVAEALRLAGVPTDPVNGRDFAASCARFLSGLTAQSITHTPQAALDKAASEAASRSVGEGWAFARRSASVPISPLTAAALAVWASDHERVVQPAVPQIW